MSTLKTMGSSEKILLNFSNMRPDENSLLIIQELWQLFSSRVLELAVDLSNPNLTDEGLLTYCSSPFWTGFQFRAGEKILSLNLDLSGCLSLASSLNKFPDYLSKMPNLKKLVINLSRTKADNIMIDALMSKEIISNNSLEFLSLDISFSCVNEEGLNTLMKNLRPLTNHLKALEIDARQVGSEVQKMASYSLKELSKMKPMEVFIFLLGGYKKLETIKEQLFPNPQTNFANLIQMTIDLSETKGVNEFLQNSYLHFVSNSGNNLKILHLEMAKSDVAFTFLDKFFCEPVFVQGLVDLNINIEGTCIGNEFTNILKSLLPNIQKLEQLTLKMVESKIDSIIQGRLYRKLTKLSKSHLLFLKKIDVKCDDFKKKKVESQKPNEAIQNNQQHLLDKINSRKSKKKGNQKVPKSERSQNLKIKFQGGKFDT